MALGKQIGEFSGQFTTNLIGPGSGSAFTSQATAEGTVTGDQGEGNFVMTLHLEFEPGGKSGPYKDYGVVGMSDGSVIGFRGQGTWEDSGGGKFRYRGTGKTSNENIYASEAEWDFPAKTWTGKLYEWS